VVLGERLYVIFADLSIATYRWSSMPDVHEFPFTVRPERIRQLPCHTVSMSSYAIFDQTFARIGKRVAPTSPDDVMGRITLTNETDGMVAGRGEEEDEVVADGFRSMGFWNFAVCGGGGAERVICCGFWDHILKGYGLDGFKLQVNTNGGHRGAINCLQVGEDGRTLVTGA
jgi:hypothetical protein